MAAAWEGLQANLVAVRRSHELSERRYFEGGKWTRTMAARAAGLAGRQREGCTVWYHIMVVVYEVLGSTMVQAQLDAPYDGQALPGHTRTLACAQCGGPWHDVVARARRMVWYGTAYGIPQYQA